MDQLIRHDSTLCFEITRHGASLGRHVVSARSITLGSGPAAMIRLPEDAAAPLHAVVNVNEDGSVWLLDLGAGRVRLGGQAVANAPLRSGDTFEIGDVTICFIVDTAEDMVEERTDPAIEVTDDTVTEDPLAFLMRSGAGATDLGDDPRAEPVVEIAAVWGDVVMDVKHFRRDNNIITIGGAVGHRWRVLGAPIAWVSPAFSKLAWMAAPAISEVRREWRDDFYAPELDRHSLIEISGGQLVLRFRPEWEGFIDLGEERTALSASIAQGRTERDGDFHLITLPSNSSLVIDIDNVLFVVREVRAGRRVVAPIGEQIDYPFMGIMAFMGFAFLMMSTLMLTAGPLPTSEIVEIPDRFAEVFVQQVQEQPPAANNEPAGTNEDEGEKAKGEEGISGRKDAKMDRASGDKVEMDQERDREIASSAGVLGALSDNGDLDNIFNSSALSGAVTGGIGGLLGAKGDQMGTNGLSSRGGGIGGGGRRAGLGGLGTNGRGSGDGTYGEVDGGRKPDGQIFSPSPPIILGSLDKSLIERVIKQHMAQFRYCYQRELNKSPDLGGKIVAKFVIAGDGSVSRATVKSSTMGSPAVESCVTRRFMQL
ncbi:MAG: hypothetical protein ACI8S6_002837, partial [Myxococcota bacterium]